MPQELATAELARILRGEALPPGRAWTDLLDAAIAHGVLPLLAAEARRQGGGHGIEALNRAAPAEAALVMLRVRELRAALDALGRSGVTPLVIKGAHLQWTHYGTPELRPRTDTDLLIAERDAATTRLVLESLGYQPLAHVTGDVAFTQFHHWRDDGAGARHALDVHRRVANPRAFAGALTFEEMTAERIPIPELGPNAWGPCSVHALLLAAIHRTAHHANSDRLIWLYDVRQLCASLTAEDWSRLVVDAMRGGVAPYVGSALARAGALLGARAPAAVLKQLLDAPAGCDAAVFSGAGGRPRDVLVSDWRHLRGWGVRARFLREHLLPSPSYMRSRYPGSSAGLLPFLYVHRALAGLARLSRK